MSSPLFAGTVGPSRYREARPSAHVAGVVACRWVGSGGWDRLLRLVPDGCADLVWDGTELLVVGAHPVAARFPVGADTRNVGLRLRPGAAGAVAGCPASDLVAAAGAPGGLRSSGELDPSGGRDRGSGRAALGGGAPGGGAVPVAALWGTAVAARLADALAAAPGPAAQLALLEDAVADRLASGRGPDPAVMEAASLLGVPGTAISAAGRAVGLSARELRRRFLAHVGYGPKALHRVLRFRRFLGDVPAVASGAGSLAAAAAASGYADQSHLGRECRRLTGSSPAALMRRWAVVRAGPGRNVPDGRVGPPACSSPCPTTRRTRRPSGSAG